ncbi:hypothetical protein HK405_014687, partial [Cladochytrium tenue]
TSLEEFTCAGVLTDTKRETPTFVRFSSVLGSRGAPETAREVRGFATKFYTDEGNWDLVGNNIPVFFIQDGTQFPDLIHAGKPEPRVEIPQAQTAHDSFWDFASLAPESAHMLLWMLSLHATPRSFRMMGGFGVNTYVLRNARGRRHFAKFHWRPHLGRHGMTWDECQILAGRDPDFLRRDLADAIDEGFFPVYDFGVQLIPEENENDFDFDLLDCTKVVPEDLVPVRWVGSMTLDRNPVDFFAEVEQAAFCVQNLVPGIELSLDPLLSLNSYDSEAPTSTSFQSTARDHAVPRGPNYVPNRFGRPAPDATTISNDANARESLPPPRVHPLAPGFRVEAAGATRPPKFAEHLAQARAFHRSLAPEEKAMLAAAARFELARVADRGVCRRIVELF